MRIRSKIFLSAAAVLLLAGTDLLTGGVGLGGMDVGIFLKLRLPRMLTAVLAGAGLSLAGLQMQSVFRNPLADPHIMGVSAGAGTGAAVATLLLGASLPAALSGVTVAAAAFLGAADLHAGHRRGIKSPKFHHLVDLRRDAWLHLQRCDLDP